ncbi:hypothetical protein Y032_0003g1211 [Ancylostoma ceylanicum]|uniref:Uncharacterized protein n=1 Tax=Ancylostoma ceylanicum TaxID=53326 RepID=A0A016VWE4_9BILA|nr:hypothetical protein Y032_0003g1211 [Ancylostoma ceylanicum]
MLFYVDESAHAISSSNVAAGSGVVLIINEICYGPVSQQPPSAAAQPLKSLVIAKALSVAQKRNRPIIF